MSTVPTLGPKVYRYDLLWAIWSPRVWVDIRQVAVSTSSCSRGSQGSFREV